MQGPISFSTTLLRTFCKLDFTISILQLEILSATT